MPNISGIPSSRCPVGWNKVGLDTRREATARAIHSEGIAV